VDPLLPELAVGGPVVSAMVRRRTGTVAVVLGAGGQQDNDRGRARIGRARGLLAERDHPTDGGPWSGGGPAEGATGGPAGGATAGPAEGAGPGWRRRRTWLASPSTMRVPMSAPSRPPQSKMSVSPIPSPRVKMT
jgi:hypothetical protein